MNGLHELPLIIFTVLAQSVTGAFLLFSALLFLTQDKFYRDYIHKVMFILLALLGIGFVASILHLGSPLRAFNSLNRVGSSMLSNEIASGSVFFALLGGYWLLTLFNKMPKGLAYLWLILTSIVGLIFMYMMNQVYHIATVPTWNNSFTYWQFYLTIILGGWSLGYALLQTDRTDVAIFRQVPKAITLAFLLSAIVTIYQGFHLSSIVTPVQQAVDLVPDFAILTAIRLTLLAVSIALLFYLIRQPNSVMSKILIIVFALGAEMIGRTLFYGLHMTVGTAVGG
ncbi:dimethyl sulfoxide reductase [Pasteurellaceae bacterium Macca]|nr:dimethyl sulfoxide reductase [Pasteurellaceae bacterium Macca]